jgi:hypothetical protein
LALVINAPSLFPQQQQQHQKTLQDNDIKKIEALFDITPASQTDISFYALVFNGHLSHSLWS